MRTLLASNWHPNLPFTLPVFNEFLSANVKAADWEPSAHNAFAQPVTDVSMMLLRTALTQHTSAAARLHKTNLPPARYLTRGRVQTKGTGFARNLPARWTLLTQHRNRYAAALTVYEVLNTNVSIGVSRQLTLNWRGLGVVWICSPQFKGYVHG